MKAPDRSGVPMRAVLLTALAGASVAVVVCAVAYRQLGWTRSAERTSASGANPVRVESPAAPTEVSARVECEADPSQTVLDDELEFEVCAQRVPVSRAKGRELRAAFVALERAAPGTLDERAAAVLSGDGPVAEKAALLRALRDTGSPSTAHWLEVAVRSAPRDSTDPIPVLPTFALEQLSELAASDVGACTSLERIAFDEEGAAPALRRRACAAFAAVCSTDRLPELSVQLQRESDELLVAGALSALEARIPDPRVDEVLAAHGRTRSEVAIDR